MPSIGKIGSRGAGGGSGSDPGSPNNSSQPFHVPLSAALIAIAALLVGLFTIAVCVYRRSRIRRAQRDRRMGLERAWVASEQEGNSQDSVRRDGAWRTQTQEEQRRRPIGMDEEEDLPKYSSPIEPQQETAAPWRVVSISRPILASPSPPPPVYTRSEDDRQLR
jgi:hypothetical protein